MSSVEGQTKVDTPLIPVRMVNEFQYCPRLAYLEWVDGEWAESADTVEGAYRHRKIDASAGTAPEPSNEVAGETLQTRSVTLSSEALGIVAKLDLVESAGNIAVHVDYK